VITGFNTDIEHDGVVYHVQTEDKGLASPLILSLVYSGGAILASKRSPYNDLIIAGFDEEKLSQRLKQQHRLICAAISAGRIEELKNMGGARKDGQAKAAAPASTPQKVSDAMVVETSSERPPVSEEPPDTSDTSPLPEEEDTPKSQPGFKAKESAYTVYDPRRKSQKGATAESEGGLVLTILEEVEFYAGRPFAILVLLQNRSGKKEKPVSGVTLSLKILGTSFRPKLFSVKTGRDGVGAFSGELPHFDSGRAAIVIRAVVDDRAAEIRRVIHPAT
jgi:hypothetical protein